MRSADSPFARQRNSRSSFGGSASREFQSHARLTDRLMSPTSSRRSVSPFGGLREQSRPFAALESAIASAFPDFVPTAQPTWQKLEDVIAVPESLRQISDAP